MKLELIQSPFDSHSNKLFSWIKKSLSNIYDTSDDAYPYVNKKKKYKFKLSDCNADIDVYINDIKYLTFYGSTSTSGIFYFYFAPGKNRNVIQVIDKSTSQVYTDFVITAYNIHTFLAYISYKFKTIWNNIYQSLASTYISGNRVTDIDGNYLTPELTYLKEFATLMGTRRYTLFTDAQFLTFLQNIYEVNKRGGLYESIYYIQKALPDYIKNINMIPLEKGLKQGERVYSKVYKDSTNIGFVKIYPTYVFENNWGYLPNYDGTINNVLEVPAGWDTTTFQNYIGYDGTSDYSNYIAWIYTDGDLYTDSTNIGALKIKSISAPYLSKVEGLYTDTFLSADIYSDDNGIYTGIPGGKYVSLRKPSIDGTIYGIDTTGSIDVTVESSRILNPFNIVDLGCVYDDEIDAIRITYKSFEELNVLAKIEKDSTTGEITQIYNSGHPNLDSYYTGYKEENFGAVIININTLQVLDDELKDIISGIVRNIMPVHIKYYLNFITPDLWYWAGENYYTLEQIENWIAYIGDTLTWETPTSGTAENLNDMMWRNGDGWVVGDAGTLLISDDYGDTWTASTISAENLNRVYFYSDDIGVCVGDNGTILKTIDSGSNWNAKISPRTEILNDIFLISDSSIGKYRGWIVGNNGTIMESLNGGDSWFNKYIIEGLEDLKEEKIVSLSNVTDITPSNAINNDFTVKRIRGNVIVLQSIDYLSDNGNSPITGDITYDSDNPLTLSVSDITYNNDLKEIYVTVSITDNFNRIRFITKDRGILIGERGLCFRTNDGGKTWTQLILDVDENLNDVVFNGYNEITIIGDNETIIKNKSLYPTPEIESVLESELWELANIGDYGNYKNINFLNQNKGYLVSQSGVIMKTNDGGFNWSSIISDTTEDLNAVKVFSNVLMIMIGDNGTIKRILSSDTLFYHAITFNDLI